MNNSALPLPAPPRYLILGVTIQKDDLTFPLLGCRSYIVQMSELTQRLP